MIIGVGGLPPESGLERVSKAEALEQMRSLEDHGAMEYSIVVAATASGPQPRTKPISSSTAPSSASASTTRPTKPNSLASSASNSRAGLARSLFHLALIALEQHDYRGYATVARLHSSQVEEDVGHFAPLRDELAAYFTGQLETFTFPVALHGSDFQLKVWHSLQGIPYGKLRTYAQVARDIRQPNATRAVGQAAGTVATLADDTAALGSEGQLVGITRLDHEGDRVEFAIEQGPKGPAAADVRRL